MPVGRDVDNKMRISDVASPKILQVTQFSTWGTKTDQAILALGTTSIEIAEVQLQLEHMCQ